MHRNSIIWFLLIIISIFLALADLCIGSANIPISDTFNFFLDRPLDIQVQTIISEYRIPKTITAIFAGIALSISGLQMQTIFRNPLAGPYILGISSGAAMGISLLLMTPLILTTGNASISALLMVIFAWLGAWMVLFIIFGVSLRVKNIMTVLIIGILISSALTSIINILQYFSEQSQLKTFVVWSMGSLSGVTLDQLPIFMIPILSGIVIAFFSSGYLNLYLLGENYAQTSGMNLSFTRLIIFLSTGLLTGTVTAYCGPIGFIGIIVPHLARMLFKTSDHKKLIPASALIGASFLLASDIISALPDYGGALPVNSVTALLGIPIVIKIMLTNKVFS
jgi:iron complex transport system permease protein